MVLTPMPTAVRRQPVDHNGGLLGVESFPATESGYEDPLAWLVGCGPVVRVGVSTTRTIVVSRRGIRLDTSAFLRTIVGSAEKARTYNQYSP